MFHRLIKLIYQVPSGEMHGVDPRGFPFNTSKVVNIDPHHNSFKTQAGTTYTVYNLSPIAMEGLQDDDLFNKDLEPYQLVNVYLRKCVKCF
jgi:hypothetical protein